jgi:hypothetical protein
MGTLALITKRKVRIGEFASAEILPSGAIEMDASIEENHVHENEITQFPVEEGVDIADHVRRQPDRVTIRGIVTDHPINLGGAALSPDRSLDAYYNVVVMINEATLITVVTSLREYENMMVESMEVPRTNRLGNAVEMSLSLREVLTTQVDVAAATTDKGTQNPSAI